MQNEREPTSSQPHTPDMATNVRRAAEFLNAWDNATIHAIHIKAAIMRLNIRIRDAKNGVASSSAAENAQGLNEDELNEQRQMEEEDRREAQTPWHQECSGVAYRDSEVYAHVPPQEEAPQTLEDLERELTEHNSLLFDWQQHTTSQINGLLGEMSDILKREDILRRLDERFPEDVAKWLQEMGRQTGSALRAANNVRTALNALILSLDLEIDRAPRAPSRNPLVPLDRHFATDTLHATCRDVGNEHRGEILALMNIGVELPWAEDSLMEWLKNDRSRARLAMPKGFEYSKPDQKTIWDYARWIWLKEGRPEGCFEKHGKHAEEWLTATHLHLPAVGFSLRDVHAKHVDLRMLCVPPPFRDRKLEVELLRDVKNMMVEKDEKRYLLTVVSDDDEQEFYRAHGFRTVHVERKFFGHDKRDAYFMAFDRKQPAGMKFVPHDDINDAIDVSYAHRLSTRGLTRRSDGA